MRQTAARPQLLTVTQAAALLNVSDKTIRRWLADEKVPYVKLPSGGVRIPQAALIASLTGTFDLGAELAELDARLSDTTDEQIAGALEEHDD